MYKKLLVLSLGAVLAACNSGSSSSRGGGGGGTTEPQLTQGRFIDSPVAGLVYETNSLVPATTDSNGTFQYRVGEEVRFLLGEQVLAKAPGKNILTMLDVVPGARADYDAGATLDEIYNKYPQILNIARLLQSLDVDRLSSSGSKNGLQIPIEAQRIAADFGTIDFSAVDLYADTTSQGYKFICEVLKTRAPEPKKASACDGEIVVSREDAAAEVTETENAVASGQPLNRLPVVSAGRDQIVAETREVSLQGSVSDADAGDRVDTIEWVQSDRDGVALESPTITINNPNQLNAGFVAPEVAQDQNFYFTLTVTDSQGGVGSDTIAILVADDNDLNPIADAGASQRVGPGDVVTLDGTQSTDDIDGSNLTFAWTQQEGLRVELSGADTPEPTFTAPSPAENAKLVFQLTVTDSSGQTGSDTVTINIQVSPGLASPEASAGEDQNVESGQDVTLNGSGSDPDGDPLTYQWEQIDAPEGMEVTISNADSAQASFTAPEVEETTTLRFKLTVDDGLSEDEDETQVTIAPPVVCSLADPNTYPICFENILPST